MLIFFCACMSAYMCLCVFVCGVGWLVGWSAMPSNTVGFLSPENKPSSGSLSVMGRHLRMFWCRWRRPRRGCEER